MPKVLSLDRKGSRYSGKRTGVSRKKRHYPQNRYAMESEEASTSASAKKLKTSSDCEIDIDSSFGYRIVNFISVFSAISEAVKCKTCNGDVKFTESSVRGLGFKLNISCPSCEPVRINSSPLIDGKAYDVNRRVAFAFRLLGIGLAGIEKFCGIMDIPTPIFHSFYDKIVNNIHIAAASVCQVSMKNAIDEEKEMNVEKGDPKGLTVSGSGTWRNYGFSSLFGASTLIGYYTGKVIDIVVKSSFCKKCDYWKQFDGTEEHEEWKTTHKDECSANREDSAAKMEVDGVNEMFGRSEEKYGIKYRNYIDDEDSKTFKGIVDSKPYGKYDVNHKESIGHVQKRAATAFRNLKKENKGLDENGKLTAKLIDELTIYYSLAIARFFHSIEEMKNAIWATYYHKISTDEKPQHDRCPPGEDSWCTWQKAKAGMSLQNYKHEAPLHMDVQEAIRPVYEQLSSDNLLSHYLGGFTQNNNESVNAVIWSMAPETTSNDLKIVEIAANIAMSIFNDGYNNVLLMMQVLGLTIGPYAQRSCEELDKNRISVANVRAEQETKEARKLKRATRKDTDISS